MAKFRKKPVVIEAEQFRPRAKSWPKGVYQGGVDARGRLQAWIRTANGDIPIERLDWICRQRVGKKWDVWPVKPDIFAATYEPADPPTEAQRTQP